MQSRYYDPTVGRFINADGIVGANGGIQGYNMFAYCNNNPIVYYDPSGQIVAYLLDNGCDGTFYERILTGADGGTISAGNYYIPNSSCNEVKVKKSKGVIEKLLEDISNFNWNNESETVALNSHYFSSYKGTLILRTDFDRSGSFGIIFLTRESNNRQYPEDVVRHEYGHTRQFKELGLISYLLCIGLPSVLEWGTGDYYDKPWEVLAEVDGGVQSRPISQSKALMGAIYLEASKHTGVFAWLLIDWD